MTLVVKSIMSTQSNINSKIKEHWYLMSPVLMVRRFFLARIWLHVYTSLWQEDTITTTCFDQWFVIKWSLGYQLPWQSYTSSIVSAQDNLTILRNHYGEGKHIPLAINSRYLDNFRSIFSKFWFDLPWHS